MKTQLTHTILFLVAVASITGAQAGESLSDRIKEALKEPPHPRGATAVAAVRG